MDASAQPVVLAVDMDKGDTTAQAHRMAWWLVAVVLLSASSARAANIVVTTAADAGPGCTLRNALTAANTDAAAGGCTPGQGADTITFDLTLPATITLTTNAELTVESEVTILGPGAEHLVIDGNRSTRVMQVGKGGRLTASGLTFQHGKGDGRAGGLVVNSDSLSFPSAATLTDCVIVANSPEGVTNVNGVLSLTNCRVSANEGRGLINSGQATLVRCTVSGNMGGGIANFGVGGLMIDACTIRDNIAPAQPGGAVSNQGTVNLVHSTVSGNQATTGGAIDSSGTVTVLASTLVANMATAGEGGAVRNNGFAYLYNCTIAGNTATTGAGLRNGGRPGPSVLRLRNTIVANGQLGDNCVGPLTDDGHNLDSGSSCSFGAAGSVSNTNPNLDPAGLRDNGGPTQTAALCTSAATPVGCPGISPAINAGDQAYCAATGNLDQRGFERPGIGATRCCIGAFEANSSGPPEGFTPTPTATPTKTSIATATITPTPGGVLVGDCGGTGATTTSDLITLVNIMLGSLPISACPHGVPSGVAVDIALLVQAVHSARGG